MALQETQLLKKMPYIRNLFKLLGFDVSPYSDRMIVDAILKVCPVIDEEWPTNEQLKLVYQELRKQP